MAENIRTRALVERSILAAIALVLYILSSYVPIMGIGITFFCPIPIILLAIRHRGVETFGAVVLIGILIAILMGVVNALFFFFSLGLIGLVLGESIKRGISPGWTILLGGLASFLSTLILILVAMVVVGANPLAEIFADFNRSAGSVIGIYRRLGLSGQEIDKLEDFLKRLGDSLRMVFPSILIMGSIFNVFLNYTVARLALKRLGYQIEGFPPFSQWRLPDQIVWLFIGSWILFLSSNQIANHLGSNLLLVALAIYLIQGLAVTAHFFQRVNLPLALRLLGYLLIFFQPVLTILILGIGLFDTWFNFRKISRGNEVKV